MKNRYPVNAPFQILTPYRYSRWHDDIVTILQNVIVLRASKRRNRVDPPSFEEA